jgi:hypothetical protein
MSNKQQTAVDILCGKLAMKLGIPQAITFYIDHQEEIREAKEMEKEQMIKSYVKGHDNKDFSCYDADPYSDAKQYYEQTYGGN